MRRLSGRKYSRPKHFPQNAQHVILSLEGTKRLKTGITAWVCLGTNKRLEGLRRLRGVGRIGRIGRIGRMWERRRHVLGYKRDFRETHQSLPLIFLVDRPVLRDFVVGKRKELFGCGCAGDMNPFPGTLIIIVIHIDPTTTYSRSGGFTVNITPSVFQVLLLKF